MLQEVIRTIEEEHRIVNRILATRHRDLLSKLLTCYGESPIAGECEQLLMSNVDFAEDASTKASPADEALAYLVGPDLRITGTFCADHATDPSEEALASIANMHESGTPYADETKDLFKVENNDGRIAAAFNQASPPSTHPAFLKKVNSAHEKQRKFAFSDRTSQLYGYFQRDERDESSILSHKNLFSFHEADYTYQRRIQKVVQTTYFEIATALLVVAYTVIMCMDLQYHGMDIGYTIESPGYTEDAAKTWRGAEDSFYACTLIFGCLFCIELVLRICAAGRDSCRSAWIWFDATIIALGMLELCGVGVGFNPGMMRIMRLLRLVRLLKLVQVVTKFDSLFLLIKSIRASVSALLWSFLFMSAVQVVMGLLLCQILQDFLLDDEQDRVAQRKVFEYFGTFSRTMLTMFEISFANWVPSCRALMDNVHESFSLFYIFYRCMFCFAVLRVITAVFITETNRVLEHDDDLNKMKKNREARVLRKKLQGMFRRLDIDGDGVFDWNELDQFINSPEVSSAVHSIGLDRFDLMKLFWLLDKGNGTVPVEEFLTKTGKLTGQSKAIDMQTLLKLTHRIDRVLQSTVFRNGQQGIEIVGKQAAAVTGNDAKEIKGQQVQSVSSVIDLCGT